MSSTKSDKLKANVIQEDAEVVQLISTQVKNGYFNSDFIIYSLRD